MNNMKEAQGRLSVTNFSRVNMVSTPEARMEEGGGGIGVTLIDDPIFIYSLM